MIHNPDKLGSKKPFKCSNIIHKKLNTETETTIETATETETTLKLNLYMEEQKMITVRNLTKKFGSFTANDDLSFDVYKGEIFGFLGANGAGKTTTIRILCGLSSPTSGEVKVAGFDIYRETEKIKRNIGYMSQKFSLYEDLTVSENIQLFAGIYGISNKKRKEKEAELLKKLELEKAKNKLIAGLPLGWKQKLAFSVAIFHDPKIVFLDEPTGGVDPVTRRKFWDLIY